MSRKQFVMTVLLRVCVMLLLLGSAYLISSCTAAPAWVIWLEGICAVMQVGFLAGDWARYQKTKENTTDMPS